MRVVLLGPPGAGKGTQAEVLCKEFSIPHISTGNMLREAIEAGSKLGKQAKKLMDEGILVPDDVINRLVVERIREEDCKEGYLFDGFPRTIPQALALDKEEVFLDIVIEIDVPDEVVVKRMSGRRVHPKSGRNYHIQFNPPKIPNKDDDTGEPLIQRDDDKAETVKDRLKVYRSQTLPLIEFYLTKSNESALTYIRISGEDTPSIVSTNILERIKQ